MFLVCNVCHPEIPAEFTISNDIPGALAIAKWYPGGNGAYYYNSSNEEWATRFQDFLDEHSHIEIKSEHYHVGAGQENPIRIEYESIGLPI